VLQAAVVASSGVKELGGNILPHPTPIWSGGLYPCIIPVYMIPLFIPLYETGYEQFGVKGVICKNSVNKTI